MPARRDDDITNYTNRAPYPTLHLMREASIDRAVQAFPEAEAIFEVNMATMEKLGHEGWAALDVGPPRGMPATVASSSHEEEIRRRVRRRQPWPPEIRPGQSVELLKELHILTREGKLNQDSRRKLKQVYHLFQFIEKLLQELQSSKAREGGLTLADHGAGKSYLGFIIYDLFFKALKTGHIYGIETRAELVQKSRELAAAPGLRAHVLSEPQRGRRRPSPRTARAHRRRHRAARLRHRHRRRHRLRPAEARAVHGAGALLPGRGGARAERQQGAAA